MQADLRAVLFDATGTLIDPREPVGETYSRIARNFGVAIPPWRMSDAFGRIVRTAAPRVFEDVAVGEIAQLERRWWREIVRDTIRAADSSVQFEDFDSFFDTLFKHFAGPSAWVLRAGTREALAALRAAGYLLGVASNFDHRLPNLLKSLEIADFFDTVSIPANCGVAKPARGIFEAALEQLDAAPEQVLYVGHHPELDLAGAARAGLHILDVAELRDLSELPARMRALATLG